MKKEETVAVKLTTVEKDGLKGPVKQVKQSRYKAFTRFGKVYMGEPEGTQFENKNFIDSYNEAGAKTENIKYNTNGSKNIITYNEKELPILEKDYMMGGLYNGKKVTTYNENGDMLLFQAINEKDEVSFSYQNTYDEGGRLLEEFSSSQNKTMPDRKTTRTYNDEGHLIELIMTEGDKINKWIKFRLNFKGNPLEQDELNPDGTVVKTTKYRYLYDRNGDRKPTPPYVPVDKEDAYQVKTENDHHGNWVKKITYFDEKAVSVFIKEITYYGEENKQAFLTQDEFFNRPLNLNNELSNPITKEEWEAWYTKREKKEDIIFTEAEAMWLA